MHTRRTLLGRALAATLTLASLTVVAVPVSQVYAAPVPSNAITPAPIAGFVGEPISFTVAFDNTSTSDAGYGPYIDLLLPIGGADGNDGIAFTSASYIGSSISPLLALSCSGTAVTHPLTGLAVACPTGAQLVVLQLPFGSFTSGQPVAPITINASVSDLADIGTALSITSTPGFAYGSTPTGNTPIEGAPSTTTFTPDVVHFTKSYVGPESETATGPNYPRSFRLSVDIATGQKVNDLTITDLLPPQYAFLAVTAIGPAGSTATETPTVGVPDVAPRNDLVRTWTSTITGNASAEDAFVEFSYFIPELNASLASIIDSVSGDDVLTRNDGKMAGTVDPKDIRDLDLPLVIDPDTLSEPHPDDVEMTAKSIAVQKAVVVQTDVGQAGPTPDDTLQYTINGQVSDYFTFGNVLVDDVLGDGQTFVPGFTPQLSITENGVTTTTTLAGNFTVDATARTTCGDGTTALHFDVSDAYLASLAANGAGGVFTGGRVNGATTGPATFAITYRAVVDDAYTCLPGPGDALDPNDFVENDVTVIGDVYDNLSQTAQAPNQVEADTSGTTLPMNVATVAKSIYARNGVIGGAAGSPAQYAAGDLITYRLRFAIPSSDITGFTLADYLPLPVLYAAGLSATAGACTTPGVNQWCYGPADTFHTRPLAPTPTVSFDATANSITWTYGTYDDPANVASSVDLLFTLRISNSPFRDGLFLTNQVQADHINSFGDPQTAPAIIQIELTEPVLRIVKGVVDADSPVETYSGGTKNPTGRTFAPVGTACPGFSPPSIRSTNLAGAPNADVSGVDADDIVRFAMVVENTGAGLNGAFDVTIGDTLPAGLSIPPGGLKLCVTDGNGVALAHTDTGFFTGTPSSGAAVGTITLTDGAAGALAPYSAASGTNLAVISYELQIDPTTAFSATLTNTATITRYSATEGGPDFTPVIPAANLTNSAAVVTRTPGVAKAVTGTNQAHTTGSNVAIGEVVEYTVTVTVPEGQVAAAAVVDTLPSGLAITSVDSLTASAGISSSVGAMATVLANTQAALAAPGRPLTINLGTLTNSDTNDAVAETIVVVYRAVVLDVGGNQNAVPLDNSARLNYTGGSSNAGSATVVVIEPDLSILKTASPANADAGDLITYTILVQHSAASAADAFNVTLSDLVPAGLTYTPGSLASLGPTPPSSISDAGAPTLSAAWTTFPMGASTQLTYTATLASNIAAPSTITNTASTSWTSLPTGGDPVSRFNVDGRERTGAGGVDDHRRSDTASVTTSAAGISKTLIATSSGATAGNNVTIGETVTYDLRVTLPEGSLPSGFTVTDGLPVGLRYVAASAQVITTTGGGTPPSALAADFAGTLPAPTFSGGASDGDDLVATFGATAITSDNDPSNNSFVVRLTAVVSDIAGNIGAIPGQATLDNDATVQISGDSPVTSGIVRTPVVEPRLGITKTVNPTAVSQGDNVTVTFVVGNTGLSDAFEVRLQDVLDPNYDANSVVELATPAGFVFSRTGSTITYTGGDIAVGASLTFRVTVDLVSPLAAGTVVPNTATVTDATTLPGSVPGERNEPDTAATALLNVVGPDLVLVKDDGTTSVTAGSTTTYSLTITNVGGFQATGVYVDDTIPAGATFGSIGGPSCSDGGVVSGKRRILVSGAIAAAGGFVVCTITLNITAPVVAGTSAYFNTATVVDDGLNGPDPTPANNTEGDTDTLAGRAPDVRVVKDDGVQTRSPGETYTYTLDVTNTGNIGVSNVLVRDTLPAGLSFVGCASTLGTVSIACAESGGVVTITYSVLAGAGGAASLQITVRVDNPVAPAIDQLVNAVTVTDDGANGIDVTPANNADSDTDNLDAVPDLRILKTASTLTASPGDTVTYSLSVSNGGLQDATGTVVTDTAPAGLTIVCSTASPAATSCDGTTITWGPGLSNAGVVTGGVFRAGQTRSLGYDATVDDPLPAGTDQLVNTVAVADDGANGVDPTPLDNIDTATVAVVGADIDLTITKTDADLVVSPGDVQTYSLTIRNTGNIGAIGVVVTDVLPAGLQFVSCPALPVVCNSGSLPSVTWVVPALAGGGASVTVQFVASVRNPAPAGFGTIINPASVTDDGTNGTDPTPANNSTTDTDTLSAAPDLDVTKNDGDQVRSPGDQYDYTLVVRNKGDQTATGVVVVDTLPAELAFVSCPAAPSTCTHSGEPTGGTVTWNLATMSGGALLGSPPPGSSVTLTVRVRVVDSVPSGVTQIVNTAAVRDDGANGADPTPLDNADDDTDTFSVAPDMAITKTDGVVTAAPGATLTCVLTVVNNGAQAATGVVVSDTLPAGVSFVSCTPTCDSSSLPTLTWNNLTESIAGSVTDPLGFDADGSATLIVVVTVDAPAAPGIDDLLNTALVADDGANGADPTPLDNAAMDLDALAAAPDLVVTKDDGVASAAAGDTLTYSVSVRNVGNQDATGVNINDTLPPGTTFAFCTGGCLSSGAPTIVWPVGVLPSGGQVSFTIAVTVDSPVTPGTLGFLNTIAATDDGSNGADPTPVDNTATDNDTFGVDLAVSKTDGQAQVAPGSLVTYTIVVDNNGPSTLQQFVLVDTLPAALSAVAYVPSAGSYDPATGAWTGFGYLRQGDTLTLTVSGRVDPAAVGDLVNAVTVTSPAGFPDSNPLNDTASDVDVLAPAAELRLEKSLVGELRRGQSATYQLTVTNVGPSVAKDVVITDVLPAGLSFTSASGTGWTCASAGGTPTCTLAGNLAPAASSTVSMIVNVTAATGSTVVNTATVRSSTPALVGGGTATDVDDASGVVAGSLPTTGATFVAMLEPAVLLIALGVLLLLVAARRRLLLPRSADRGPT